MSWLLYLPHNSSALESRLFKAIDPLFIKSSVEISRSLPDLFQRFHQSLLCFPVMVLCIASREYLEMVLSQGDLFKNIKIILILPDEDQETMAMGFKLLPRFVTWVESDFGNLATVLKRMLHLYDVPIVANEQITA